MKRLVRMLVAALPIIFIAASPVTAALLYIDELYGVQISSNKVYGTGLVNGGATKNLLADIYNPVDIGLAPVQASRPTVVLQDGGAWTSASKTRARVTIAANYLAKRGYTVVVTDYRQGAPSIPFVVTGGPDATVTVGATKFGNAPWAGLTTSGHTYNIYPGINPIRAGIEDFALAIDWTRTNPLGLAELSGVDPNRIGIAGGSAGGIDALLLQYNNNPVDARYRAQAVVALVSTMMNNYNRIQAGGPPVFLLNNTLDAVVPWSPEMSQRFVDVGIYREQWFQAPDLLYHDVDWNLDLGGLTLMERVRDFLAYQLAGGPVYIPEASSVILMFGGVTAIGIVRFRKRLWRRSNQQLRVEENQSTATC